jgi:ELWxxDGT repeat protein
MWSMRNIILLGLVVLFIIILYACTLGRSANEEPTEATFAQDLPALGLAVQAQNANSTLNTVGQTINYSYVVTNNGSTALQGPVTIADDKVIPVNCPALNTVFNQNDNLDPGESLTCNGSYAITQADLNAGQVTNIATAAAGGITSNQVSTTVQMTQAKVLEFTGIANPTTYNQTGQTITFTYTVKNIGTANLGPAQFVIQDDHIGTVNCGDATTLTPNQILNCTASYTTTQNDLGANQLTFTADISGGGAANIAPLSIAVTNTSTPSNAPSNIVRGSTIKHQVNDGEWMIQIARCYGADFTAVRNANPQVIDPHWIYPVTDVLTVPNVGSNGNIFGPPCVVYYTALAGDTWESIAAKHDADLAVLREANKDKVLAAGVKLKIPIHSAGGNVVVTPQPTTQPIRLTIPAGSTSVMVSGTVNPQATVRYVLGATQGQVLNVKVTATVNEVGLAVYSPANVVLKPMNATLTFNGTVPANGDHFIDISSLTGANIKQFTLEVSLTAPAPPTVPPAAGPVERVADINVGAGDSSPSYLSVFNNILYFRADGNDTAGPELWRYDAATKTQARQADIYIGPTGSDPAYLMPYNTALYFSANGNDGAGVELWRFNGTSPGRMTEINVGPGNGNPAYMMVFNGLLYFSANGNDGTGVELWRTDGTGVSRAADVYNGQGDSNPAYLTVYRNELYFSATTTDGGTELWKYNGTAASRVADINVGVGNSSPAYLTVFNDVLYFSANAGDTSGVELWKYDGTNVTRAADINTGPGDSAPAFLTVFNGTLYFSANGNDNAGFELWKFDGTTATRAADINTTGDSFPSYLVVYNNELYFQANGGDGAGKELWKFKGP